MKLINLSYDLLQQDFIRENSGDRFTLPSWAQKMIEKYNHQQLLLSLPTLLFICSKTGNKITVNEPTFDFRIWIDSFTSTQQSSYFYLIPSTDGINEEIRLLIDYESINHFPLVKMIL